ncbi:MAG TPA: BadF/BadG/BcrA/BcrD ATPase family protein [Dongiaceae bacterium]|nr:BadF/BadG/BcrA/BcrD ATPase family protein [Dongiaceae bacterium]
MSEMLYLGIDGGGSKCRARIRDSAGRLRGAAEGGHANIYRAHDEAVASILATARAAAAAAELHERDLHHLHAGFGLAGITTEKMARAIEAQSWPFASVTADNDAYAACLGAHEGHDGGIVITGTGSAALAVVGGHRRALGGWGFQIGDDGSGARIGHAAIRRAVLAGDNLAPHSPLLDAILAKFDNDLAGITAWARHAEAGDYAQYAPQVLAAGESGDGEAIAILRAAGASLGDMLVALKKAGAPRLSLIGGLAQPIRPWLPDSCEDLIAPALGDPIDGAILMARRRHLRGEVAPW